MIRILFWLVAPHIAWVNNIKTNCIIVIGCGIEMEKVLADKLTPK